MDLLVNCPSIAHTLLAGLHCNWRYHLPKLTTSTTGCGYFKLYEKLRCFALATLTPGKHSPLCLGAGVIHFSVIAAAIAYRGPSACPAVGL